MGASPGQADPAGGAGSGRRNRWWDAAAVLVVLAVAATAFVVRFGQPERHASGDTYFYLRQAQEFAGVPAEQADHNAREVLCSDLIRGLTLSGEIVHRCASYTVLTQPRYVAIFTSRPLWPLVLAPAVAVLGPLRGLILVSALGALLAALAVFLALRGLGLSAPAAGAAGVAFSLLPTGYWSSKLLPEGIVLAVLAAALYGAARVARGHLRGLGVLLPATAALYALKPANGAALAGGLLGAGLVLLALGLVPRCARGRAAALAIVGAGAAGVLVWFAVSALLHLPSFTDTVQDLATRHFVKPDHPNPLKVLKDNDILMWRDHVDRWWGVPEPFAVVLPAAAVTTVLLRRAGVVWAVVSLAGVSIAVLHPLISQYDRLVVSVWMCVPAAVAVLVDAAPGLLRRARRRKAPPSAPTPAPPARVHAA